MKKILFITSFLFSIFLFGCSTQPTPPELQDPLIFTNNASKTYYAQNKDQLLTRTPDKISPECVNLANYGRAVADLKNTGISETNLEDYVIDKSINAENIKLYIYSRNATASQIYSDLLLTCHKVGFAKLENILKDKTPSTAK